MKWIVSHSIVIVLLLLAAPPLHASSVTFWLTQGSHEANGFKFDITSKMGPGGTVQFHVVITEEKNTFVHPSPALSTVKYTDTSEEIHGIRALPQEKKDKSITCDFTVPEKDLTDPDLCFVFSNYVEVMMNGKAVPMPAVEFHIARLKDCFKKQP